MFQKQYDMINFKYIFSMFLLVLYNLTQTTKSIIAIINTAKAKNTHILIHLLLNNFIRNKQISKDELIKHSTTT